jgi:hypothetical protein
MGKAATIGCDFLRDEFHFRGDAADAAMLFSRRCLGRSQVVSLPVAIGSG